MEPAIEIAERGHAVASIVAYKWAAAVPELRDSAGLRAKPSCRAAARRRWASSFACPATRRRCASSPNRAPRAYYEGEIAEQIAARSRREGGGALTLDDLRDYRAEWVEPIAQGLSRLHGARDSAERPGHRGADRAGHPREVRREGAAVDNVESQHLQIEAMKLAFADVYRYVADPRSMEVTPEQMLDDAYLPSARALIDPTSAPASSASACRRRAAPIYMSVADERGMMVSFIQSNYMGFGSGVVVPGTGIACRTAAAVSRWIRSRRTWWKAASGRSTPSSRRSSRAGDGRGSGHELRRDGRRHAAARPSADRSCACSTTASSRRPRATRRAGRCHGARSTSSRRMAPDRSWPACARWATRPRPTQDPYMDFGSGQYIWRLGRRRRRLRGGQRLAARRPGGGI